MSLKRLFFLGAVLGLLVGLSTWMRVRERAAPAGVAVTTLVPATLTLEGLSAVELSIGEEPQGMVRLFRESAGEWRVATAYGVAADRERLERFFGALRGLAGEERAQGEAWWDAFGVGKQALRVRLLAGDQVVSDLVVGRSRKDPATNFVRRKEGDAIFATEGNLLGAAGIWGTVLPASLSAGHWADERIFPVEVSAVQSVEVAERVQDRWVVRGERHHPSDGAADEVVGRVTTMRGTDILDPNAEGEAFLPPAWRWIVLQKDGTRLEVEEARHLEEKEDTIVVRRLPEGPYFSVAASAWESVRSRMMPPPPEREPEKGKGLTPRPLEEKILEGKIPDGKKSRTGKSRKKK